MSEGGISTEGGSKEISRDLVQGVAIQQLDALGYRSVLDEFVNHYKGEGFEEEFIARLQAHSTHPTPDEEIERNFVDSLPGKMRRIPEKEDVRKLLVAAVYGKPFGREEGKTIITDYTLAERTHSTSLQIDHTNPVKNRQLELPQANETLQLVSQLAFQTGFWGKFETQDEIVKHLQRSKETVLLNRDGSLAMAISTPKKISEGGKGPLTWAKRIIVSTV